jgi:hypothetical protein
MLIYNSLVVKQGIFYGLMLQPVRLRIPGNAMLPTNNCQLSTVFFKQVPSAGVIYFLNSLHLHIIYANSTYNWRNRNDWDSPEPASAE